MEGRSYRLGTRGSRLALRQAEIVREMLLARGLFQDIEVVRVRTGGDVDRASPVERLGGKGVFVREVEEALMRGGIDFAVHSMKDMSSRLPAGLVVAACVGGASRNDCFLSRESRPLGEMPPGARIGTGSPRRGMQLSLLRPDISAVPVRGNVPTRVAKMEEGDFDGLVLARAGLERLDMAGRIAQDLGAGEMVPAPGQGVIAVEARSGDPALVGALRNINDEELEALAGIEFSFVRELGVGCHEAAGVLAERSGDGVLIRYFVGKEGAHRFLRGCREGAWRQRDVLGKILADGVREGWRDRFGEELVYSA